MTVRWRFAFSLAALGAACCAEAAPEVQAFVVPGRGSLELAVPPAWTAAWGEMADPYGGPPVAAIELKAGGKACVVVVAPLRQGHGGQADAARRHAERVGKDMLQHAVEKELAFDSIRGDAAAASCFTLTDRDVSSRTPRDGEWPYVTRCGVTVGSLLLDVTILEDGRGAPARRAALEMIRTARHVELPLADSEFRRSGAGLVCISRERSGPDAPAASPCLRIGPMRLGLSMAEVAKRLGRPARELKQGADVVRVYPIPTDAEEVPYWVVTFTRGKASAIQLTGREAGSLAFSSIRLGDPEKRVREVLGDPSESSDVREIGGTRWSYRPHPVSVELVDGRVYSIRVHGP